MSRKASHNTAPHHAKLRHLHRSLVAQAVAVQTAILATTSPHLPFASNGLQRDVHQRQRYLARNHPRAGGFPGTRRPIKEHRAGAIRSEVLPGAAGDLVVYVRVLKG